MMIPIDAAPLSADGKPCVFPRYPSSAGAEQVKKLIKHAERGCHAEQTMRQPIAVTTTATLNKKKLDLAN